MVRSVGGAVTYPAMIRSAAGPLHDVANVGMSPSTMRNARQANIAQRSRGNASGIAATSLGWSPLKST